MKRGLEEKWGLFRKNMMGKHVNCAARSIVSPGADIGPAGSASHPLPRTVTAANFHKVRQRVVTGPHRYHGASMVEYGDGGQQSLDKLTVEQRSAIANQLVAGLMGTRRTPTPAVSKKAYRHLQDGDILILNRRPTLHTPK
ncbi:beta and beta-prime subunits of DNA dependent RNA-polymerase [Coprinellus micaceus]|uniref:DNA-directed RNA polymerase n=1 Tax=Coprinellus micaceus TaxID=71717 RepID=A0A4Y7T3J2_COPMI|nr:beta and beta-prime subunits of DNA dependent RNA-polymerase [Coprinellus micaceus]